MCSPSSFYLRASLVSLLAVFLLSACARSEKRLDFIRAGQVEVSASLPEDPAALEAIRPYKDSVDRYVNSPLCYNPSLLSKNEAPLESSLGNLLADICLRVGDSLFAARFGQRPDMALLNHGGMRIALEEGVISVEDVYRLMPFENRLVMVELSPEALRGLIDYLMARKRAHPIAGLRLELDGDSLLRATVDGNPIDPNRSYRVVTSDYLANGGDRMGFFANPLNRYNSELRLRDAFIEHFKQTDTLKAALDGRFTQRNPTP